MFYECVRWFGLGFGCCCDLDDFCGFAFCVLWVLVCDLLWFLLGDLCFLGGQVWFSWC